MKRWILALAAFGLAAAAARACSLCEGGILQRSPTFREEARLRTARVIVHGTVAGAELTGPGLAGKTDFRIQTTLRKDPKVEGKASLVLPRYLGTGDKDKPPQYLLFCDVAGGKLDPYRGVRVQGAATVEYVKKALALAPDDKVGNLLFFFRHLDAADPEVSADAFHEVAAAADADLAAAAPKFDAGKLRRWLTDPKTPPARLSLYAMLLGSCGGDDDVALLRRLLDSKEDRYVAAADGLLAGYMQRKPREGWGLLRDTLADGRKPLLLRLAMLRTLRFCHGADARASRPRVVAVLRAVLEQGELADLAVEDLRNWKIDELTGEVLGLYGRKGLDSPLMQKAIIRYALCCKPTDATRAFLAKARKADPDSVQDVEEALKFERRR